MNDCARLFGEITDFITENHFEDQEIVTCYLMFHMHKRADSRYISKLRSCFLEAEKTYQIENYLKVASFFAYLIHFEPNYTHFFSPERERLCEKGLSLLKSASGSIKAEIIDLVVKLLSHQKSNELRCELARLKEKSTKADLEAIRLILEVFRETISWKINKKH